MKKITAAILLIIMTFMLCSAALAEDISVELDGKKLAFDVNPMLVNDRTMVPMRAIFESLGATVTWDNENSRVEALFSDGTHILLQIGSDAAYKNGVLSTLDAQPFIENGRTMVPVRFIAEASGALVSWVGETSTVKIIPQWKSSDFIPFGEYLTVPSPVGASKDFVVAQYTKENGKATVVFDITNVLDEQIIKYKRDLIQKGFSMSGGEITDDENTFKSSAFTLETKKDAQAKTFTVTIGNN